jgi:hypothetical protein
VSAAVARPGARLRAGTWLAVALLTALAALPRAWPIAERPLWFDEASTVYGVQQGRAALRRAAWIALAALALWLGSTSLRTHVLGSPEGP